jgi:hypothetical protein
MSRALRLVQPLLMLRCVHAYVRSLSSLASLASRPPRAAHLAANLAAAQPGVLRVDAVQRHSLGELQLSPAVSEALRSKGFETLTAIQAAVFPHAKQGECC